MRTRLEQFGELDAVQQRLVDEVGRGKVIRFGKAEGRNDGGAAQYAPDPDDPDAPAVDAAFLRYLILGGCDALPTPIPATGVRIAGLRITGELSLETEDVTRDIALSWCLFDRAPNFRSARLRSLFLDGSRLPGFTGVRLQATGSIFLRAVVSNSEITLAGAELGGDLDCGSAKFSASESGRALLADGLRAQGDALFRNARGFGSIRLNGAELGGSLRCDGAVFKAIYKESITYTDEIGRSLSGEGARIRGGIDLKGVVVHGEISLLRTSIDHSIHCHGATLTAYPGRDALCVEGSNTRESIDFRGALINGCINLVTANIGHGLFLNMKSLAVRDGIALNAAELTVGGTLFVLPERRIEGQFMLSGARAGSLCDKNESWPVGGSLYLDRFTYDSFSGTAATDAGWRIAWLDCQALKDLEQDFRPHPWEQCAKVLREGGHEHDARAVLIAKEERQRRARCEVLRSQEHPWKAPVRWAFDWLLWWTTDYGRWPIKASWSLLIVFVIGWVVFGIAGTTDQIKPNNPVVLRSAEWARCAETPAAHIGSWRRGGHPSQRDCFEAQEEAASYPRFNAFVYSADTLLPIVAMEMQGFWIPDETTGWGMVARWYLWLHIAVGWGLSLLAVAGLSGLIRTDNT